MEEVGVSVSRGASSPSAMFTVCTALPPLFTVYKTLITSYSVIPLALLSLLELEYLGTSITRPTTVYRYA